MGFDTVKGALGQVDAATVPALINAALAKTNLGDLKRIDPPRIRHDQGDGTSRCSVVLYRLSGGMHYGENAQARS